VQEQLIQVIHFGVKMSHKDQKFLGLNLNRGRNMQVELSLELNMVDKDQGTVSGNGRKHRQRAMWL
jgi:hypothetical protein